MSLSPKHERGNRPIPAHPYRDTAIVNAGLAIAIVVLAALTSGDVARAALVAVVFFVVATTWSWWRFHERIKAQAANEATRVGASGKADAVDDAGSDDDPDIGGNARGGTDGTGWRNDSA